LISCSCIYKELGDKYGWEYKEQIFVSGEEEETFVAPEGYQPICATVGGYMWTYPFNGLPQEIYEDGPTEEMANLWGEMLQEQGRLRWTGVWPGVEDCERLGFWCVSGPGGFKKVEAGMPGATHDLNRLYHDARWDRSLKRFELKEVDDGS